MHSREGPQLLEIGLGCTHVNQHWPVRRRKRPPGKLLGIFVQLLKREEREQECLFSASARCWLCVKLGTIAAILRPWEPDTPKHYRRKNLGLWWHCRIAKLSYFCLELFLPGFLLNEIINPLIIQALLHTTMSIPKWNATMLIASKGCPQWYPPEVKGDKHVLLLCTCP